MEENLVIDYIVIHDKYVNPKSFVYDPNRAIWIDYTDGEVVNFEEKCLKDIEL